MDDDSNAGEASWPAAESQAADLIDIPSGWKLPSGLCIVVAWSRLVSSLQIEKGKKRLLMAEKLDLSEAILQRGIGG